MANHTVIRESPGKILAFCFFGFRLFGLKRPALAVVVIIK
jgi:hypothetical protein